MARLSVGCVTVERKNVFKRRRTRNVRSAVAVVTGIAMRVRNNHKTGFLLTLKLFILCVH